MTYAQLERALGACPGYLLWRRLLGVTPDDPVTPAGQLTFEVLNAICGYGMVPTAWATDVGVFDIVHGWATAVAGDISNQVVCVVNRRYLMLSDHVVGDIATKERVQPPESAAPVLTTVLHLQALRHQVAAKLATDSQVEASEARAE